MKEKQYHSGWLPPKEAEELKKQRDELLKIAKKTAKKMTDDYNASQIVNYHTMRELEEVIKSCTND